jgi:hypothetical protein
MTSCLLAVLAAGAALLALLVPAAGAKEGVVARVLTPVSRDSEPGTKVTVAWTLTFVEAGKRRPFGGGYVFVRLFGPNGTRTPLAYGVEARQRGRYRARVTVPRGGVTRVAIGIMGSVCGRDRTGCRPAPKYFRIVGPALR